MTAPKPGTVAATIRSLLPSLLPAEHAVATLLLERPADVVEMSSQQVGDAAGVSRATVVRAAQSMGFTGYQQLRVLLARDAGFRAHAAGGPAVQASATTVAGTAGVEAASGAEAARIVAATFRHAAASIAGMPALLTPEGIDRAVTALAEARRLQIVGNGLSGPVAMDAAARLTAIGRPAEYSPDVVTQQITARLLGPADAALVISGSGVSAASVRAARAAHDAGASVIAVTAFARTALTDVADTALIVTMPDLTFREEVTSTSRLPQVILIEALVAAVAARLGDAASAAKALALETIGDTLAE